METKSRIQKTATIELPVSEYHGLPVFSDFLTEIQKQFDLEKNIKNHLYYFIASHNLLNEYAEFRENNPISSDSHRNAVEALFIIDLFES